MDTVLVVEFLEPLGGMLNNIVNKIQNIFITFLPFCNLLIYKHLHPLGFWAMETLTLD